MSDLTRQRSRLQRYASYVGVIRLATVFLYLTLLLGVSTRATGAGLACNANWPLCDGGVLNLFPATLPSAFEWIHRVVAMIAGLTVLAAAATTYRAKPSRDVLAAVALGTLLLPVQVLLGRETVLTFTPPVLAAHYWVAMTIYGAFVLAVVRTRSTAGSIGALQRALVLAAAMAPVAILLGPPVIQRYSAPIQTLQYAFVLLAFAALLYAVNVGWHRGPDHRAFRGLLFLSTALFPVVVALMRQRIVHPTSAIADLHPIAVVVLLGSLFAVTLWAVFGAGESDADQTPLRRS